MVCFVLEQKDFSMTTKYDVTPDSKQEYHQLVEHLEQLCENYTLKSEVPLGRQFSITVFDNHHQKVTIELSAKSLVFFCRSDMSGKKVADPKINGIYPDGDKKNKPVRVISGERLRVYELRHTACAA